MARTYLNAIAIVIESALPYTLCGIAFLVTYGIQNDLEILFLSLYGMFTCISPQLIVLRVIKGRAWTRRELAHTVSTMACGHGSTSLSDVHVTNSSAGRSAHGAGSTLVNVQLQTISKVDGSSTDLAGFDKV